VLDLQRGCLINIIHSIRYVTLSYVWGQTAMLQLQRRNHASLMSEGSLDRLRDALPRTIIDAIDFLRNLGERYLWVDGLCLIQDDVEDVALGISKMHMIYGGSYFTIAAATGHDANAGLPALRRDPDLEMQRQPLAHFRSGLTMTLVHGIDWHLQKSCYNQRGWTLQELVLPQRTLIFVDEQVHFRCQVSNWFEGMCADQWDFWLDSDDCHISRIPDPAEGFSPSCWAYQKLCEDFSKRVLRDPGDVLRALSGVMQPMAIGMATPFIEGLPADVLDHFLLFISAKGDLQRRQRYASFSWAGWQGFIMWPRENFEWTGGITSPTTDRNRRDMSNIIQFLKHGSLIQWSSQGRHSAPSLARQSILQYVNQRPDIFRSSASSVGEADNNAKRKLDLYHDKSADIDQGKSVKLISDSTGYDIVSVSTGTQHEAMLPCLDRENGGIQP
jgi:hypothetical protein